jgi:LacI family transcriptional regulator
MHNKRAATSIDVAELAGVSQPTVSRALRDDPRVAGETRDRVRRAAATLRYVPSQRGRALATRKTDRIGVVVSSLANPLDSQLLDLVQGGLAAAGLHMIVFTDGDEELGPGRLLDGSIDGVILTTAGLDSELGNELRARELPLVMLGHHTDAHNVDVCAADNVGGAALAADELAALGHSQIGAIFGPSATSTGRDRRRGFSEALAGHGLELRAEAVREGPFSYDFGRAALAELMSLEAPPTAVFCGDDTIALGAINLARALDLKIFEQLSLIGFGDIALAGWELFALTTVSQNLALLTDLAVQRMRLRLDAPQSAPARFKVRTELVRRSTHGPPPGPQSAK